VKYQLPIILTVFAFLTACTHYSPSPKKMAVMEVQAQKSLQILNSAPVKHVSYKSTVTASDLISAQDVLNVNVFKVPDLSAEKLTVEGNGMISLPLIGSVKVQGLTIPQAEQMITKRLAKFMQDPKVNISRTEKALAKRVTVEGEVKTPGIHPIKGNLSFLQAIALSQGLSKVANTRNVLLYRDGTKHHVNLELIRLGKVADPELRNDDRIVVLLDTAKETERKIIEYLPAVTSPFIIFRN